MLKAHVRHMNTRLTIHNTSKHMQKANYIKILFCKLFYCQAEAKVLITSQFKPPLKSIHELPTTINDTISQKMNVSEKWLFDAALWKGTWSCEEVEL